MKAFKSYFDVLIYDILKNKYFLIGNLTTTKYILIIFK